MTCLPRPRSKGQPTGPAAKLRQCRRRPAQPAPLPAACVPGTGGRRAAGISCSEALLGPPLTGLAGISSGPLLPSSWLKLGGALSDHTNSGCCCPTKRLHGHPHHHTPNAQIPSPNVPEPGAPVSRQTTPPERKLGLREPGGPHSMLWAGKLPTSIQARPGHGRSSRVTRMVETWLHRGLQTPYGSSRYLQPPCPHGPSHPLPFPGGVQPPHRGSSDPAQFLLQASIEIL